MPKHVRPNPRAELFALQVAMGMAAVDAYMHAYGKMGRRVATSNASALLAKPEIALKVNALRKEHFAQVGQDGFLSLDETRRGLAQIWRCALGELIDERGMLVIEKVRKLPAWCLSKFRVTETSTTRTGKKHSTTVVRRTAEIELTDKLRAAQLDCELRGDAPPPDESMPTDEKIARRKRALALLAKLPGHGGHLLPAIDVVP